MRLEAQATGGMDRSDTAETPRRPDPPSPTTVRRVGGGFIYQRDDRYTEAVEATAAFETYRALPANGTAHTATDIAILTEILKAAEVELDAAGQPAAQQVS